MPYTTRIAELLLNSKAVQLNPDSPFTWSSGIKSPVYCDTRLLYSHPQARNEVVKAFISRIQSLHIEPDVIAGIATGAIGWGAIIADRLDLPFVYVRAKPKAHGTKKQVEGDIPKGKDVLLIEDLFSTGKSAINAVNALRTECDAHVTDVVSMFSYEMESAAEHAQEAGVRFHSLSTFGAVLDVAVEQGRLDQALVTSVQEFSKDPEHWGK